MPRKIHALSVLIALTAVGVGVAMASEGGSASPEPTPVSAPAHESNDSPRDIKGHASARVDAEPQVSAAADRFQVLRAGRTPASEMSADALAQANTIARGKPFVTHTVADRPHFKFYVLKTADSLCVYQRDSAGAGGGCTDDMAGFLRGGMSYGHDGAKGFRLTAFMPDGTSNVTLTFPDATSKELELSSNLATVTVEGLPERAKWTLPDGSVESQEFGGLAEDPKSAESKSPTAVSP